MATRPPKDEDKGKKEPPKVQVNRPQPGGKVGDIAAKFQNKTPEVPAKGQQFTGKPPGKLNKNLLNTAASTIQKGGAAPTAKPQQRQETKEAIPTIQKQKSTSSTPGTPRATVTEQQAETAPVAPDMGAPPPPPPGEVPDLAPKKKKDSGVPAKSWGKVQTSAQPTASEETAPKVEHKQASELTHSAEMSPLFLKMKQRAEQEAQANKAGKGKEVPKPTGGTGGKPGHR